MEWKLLEKYRLRGTLAYWEPGKWFNYACIDRSVRNWNQQTKTNWTSGTDPQSNYTAPYGTNPDRIIDPIIGGEVALTVDF
jgi:hypothetical protein